MKNIWGFIRKDLYLTVVVTCSVLYGIFFSVVSVLRYRTFSYTDFDSAIFIHEAWKILHGSAEISILCNAPIWGNAMEFISFILAPYYALAFCDPRSLFILQSVLLGGAAIPLFLIARQKIPPPWALSLAISYLFAPSVWYCNLYEFNPLSMTTFTLMMAFYFFQTNRFLWFMLFVILSMINRLDVGLVTATFGVYALVTRRPWKWVLVPFFLSSAWVSLGLFVLIPQFKHLLGYDMAYHKFGKGFTNVMVNIVSHPSIVLDSLFTKENGNFLIQILCPVLFFSLVGIKEFLICGLSLLQHLLSNRLSEHTIFYHYTSTITPFVYISAAYGIKKFHLRHARYLAILPALISFGSNLSYGPLFRLESYRPYVIRTDMDLYKRELVKMVPPDAAVASSFEFSSSLANRHNYYSFHYIYSGLFRTGAPYPVPKDIDMALVNFSDERMLVFHRGDSDLRMREFFEIRGFGVMAMAQNVVLFKKNYEGVNNPWLFKANKDAQLVDPLLNVDGKIALKSINVTRAQEGSFRFLDFVFHWFPLTKVPEDVWMDVIVIDENNRNVFFDTRGLCYGIYPPIRWQKNEEVLDHYKMIVPRSLKPGFYRVFIAFYSPMDKSIKLIRDGNDRTGPPARRTKLMTFRVSSDKEIEYVP